MTLIATTDLASIQDKYNNYDASLANYTYYRFAISHNVVYDILGGGQWYVEGFKGTVGYGWQMARCYAATGIYTYVRSKFNGTWNAWVAK